MSSAIETIEEIKQDVEDLQKKVLAIPTPEAGEFTELQISAMNNAHKGLEWFEGYSIDRLKRAFGQEDG